jgi:hypothetical protein
MSNIVVEEYAGLGDVTGGTAQIPGKLIAKHNITGSGTSARNTVAINDATKFLIISSDSNEAFKVGDGSVTAATTDRPLYASTYRDIEVTSSDTHIAFINK